MILLAHIMGVPVEELLAPSTSGMVTGAVLSLASVISATALRFLRK
jgi:hypothetical protein